MDPHTTPQPTSELPVMDLVRRLAAAGGSRAATIRGLIRAARTARAARHISPAPLPDTPAGRDALRWRQQAPRRLSEQLARPDRGSFDGLVWSHPYDPAPLTVREVRRAAADPAFRRQCRRRQRRAQLLLHIADRYHHRIRRLWASARGGVVLGTRPEIVREWPYRGQYAGYCRRYRLAAVSDGPDGAIRICDYRGDVVDLPALPPGLERAWLPDAPHPIGLLAARTADAEIVACWGVVDGRWQVLGLACRGVAIPQRVAAGEYTAADVLAEPNMEVRSIMALRFPGGPAALVEALGLTPIQADERGQLYDVPGGRQRLVRVTDATPGPDGVRRVYWLSVPPNVDTAAAAVAWTFGRQASEYCPTVEA